MDDHLIYSFIVDDHPMFAYQGWHLARSIQHHCHANGEDIHVQVTPEVTNEVREIFRREFKLHTIERFGDGRWCNKLAQLPNLLDQSFDRVVLLDTDTIVVGDLRPFLSGDSLQAKIVDLPSPSLAALTQLFKAAGGLTPDLVPADASDEPTLHGHANGGFYALPRNLASRFSAEWRRWARWLSNNEGLLRAEDKLMHVDQVSVALAVQISKIPFSAAPSNVNYFVHFRGDHKYLDRSRPIALVHYHNVSCGPEGLLQPPIQLDEAEVAVIGRANAQIRAHLNATLLRVYREAV